MDEIINNAPCGFLTLTKGGEIQSINRFMLDLLQYPSTKPLIGNHINVLLTKSSQFFIQLYFFPLISSKRIVEEMYLSVKNMDGDEIPILMNASLLKNGDILCVWMPIYNRHAMEDDVIQAKKTAENAYVEKHRALNELEKVLQTLEKKQQELMEASQQNAKFKLETERELQLAKTIQETSLTKDIENDNIQVLSYYHASKELSGDIFGCYEIAPHKYGIILLDVMGHGISSALITMSLQSLFQKLISQGVAAEKVMQELDQYLHELFQDNQDAWHYCTAIYINIDTKTKTMEYINAGHPPAIIQKRNGEQEELFANTPPLGMFENINFASKVINYSRGTRILLYTDGVSEAFELNMLNFLMQDLLFTPLGEAKQRIQEALEHREMQFEKYNHDDQCFILIEF